jgi:hypothetical protein
MRFHGMMCRQIYISTPLKQRFLLDLSFINENPADVIDFNVSRGVWYFVQNFILGRRHLPFAGTIDFIV